MRKAYNLGRQEQKGEVRIQKSGDRSWSQEKNHNKGTHPVSSIQKNYLL